MALKLVALAMLITAHAITIRRSQKPQYTIVGDHILDDHTSKDSKPGTPVVPAWEEKALFTQTQWQAKMGDRLFKAATVDKKAWESCGTFVAFGDSSWCAKAMPEQKDKGPRRGMHFYEVKESVPESKTSSADLVGLSYGIQGSDLWSETMSNMYNMKTKLYDCYFDGSSPHQTYGPMIKDLYSKEGCTSDKRACYATPYEAKHVCVDAGFSEKIVAKNGREYEPLSLALKDRKPLSVHLKMDVEGSEWPVLEQLLQSKEDMAKIRTLDMEVHLQNEPTIEGSHPQNDEAGVARRVAIMEGLAQKFAVTGSTLEHYHKELHGSFSKKRKEDPNFEIAKPNTVYTSNGFSMDQYCVSYVNPKLL